MNSNLNGLLFQTGHLTKIDVLKNEAEMLYILDFPNLEVKESLYRNLFSLMSSTSVDMVAFKSKVLRTTLETGDISGFNDLPSEHDFHD